MSDAAQAIVFEAAADLAHAQILQRLGEGAPQPRLEPTRQVLDLLGDPQRTFPIIHIAGTNGKTSTARISEAILRAYGLRTGLFTSPHLIRVNERIVIDGEPISNEAFAANWADIAPYVAMVDDNLIKQGEPRLTYFEVLTVLAFASFADAPIDVAVIEAGLGGEWDSTNVADADVAVFTPIELDHTDRLGYTLEDIARTKSGIIKPDSLVVSAHQVGPVATVLSEAAHAAGTDIAFLGAAGTSVASAMAVGGQVVTISGFNGSYDEQFLNLYGSHQAQNAALAVLAVESFLGGALQRINVDVVSEALATVSSPGRLQLIGKTPTVLVDAAHNPHGARSLASAVDEFFTFDEMVFVIGTLADKDSRGIIEALAPVAGRFIVVPVESERSSNPEELVRLIAEITPETPVEVASDATSALERAREFAATASKGAVIVTGSIVLVGQALAISQHAKGWNA